MLNKNLFDLDNCREKLTHHRR